MWFHSLRYKLKIHEINFYKNGKIILSSHGIFLLIGETELTEIKI